MCARWTIGPEEAALVDGCRRWQAFMRVVVPQMGSAIAAVAAILALSVWGEFLIPLLLTSTENSKPVTVLITEYVGKYTTNYPILAAAGRARAAAARAARAFPQPPYHECDGGLL